MEIESEKTEEDALNEVVDKVCRQIRSRVEKRVWGKGRKEGNEEYVRAIRRFKRKKNENTNLEEYLEKRYSWFCDSMMLENVSNCYMEFNTEASELSVSEDLKQVETSYLDIRRSQRDEWRNMSAKILTKGIAALKEQKYRKARDLFRDALKFDPESERARSFHAEALKAAEREENRASRTKFEQYRDKSCNRNKNGLSGRVGQKRNRSEAEDDSNKIDEELRRRISGGDAMLLRRMIIEERNREKSKKMKKKKKKKKKKRKKEEERFS